MCTMVHIFHGEGVTFVRSEFKTLQWEWTRQQPAPAVAAAVQ